MKRLLGAGTAADELTLQMLKSMLDDESIACMIRNESLSVAKGDIPASECVPELWIVDDKDYDKAQLILEEWKRSDAEPRSSWMCPQCNEPSEGQFSSCWKCGTERGYA